jgi:hypothetical protein
MRATLRWIVAAFGLLLAGALIDAARAAPPGGLRSELARHVGALQPGAPIQAAVLLQRSDCTGNIRLFDLLHRPDIRDRLHLAVIWYVGPDQDTTGIRALLPAWTLQAPLQRVPKAALGELARLGHRSTPTIVVLDQEGRIRFTSQSPRSSREFAGLRHIIEGLTWIEEL